MTHTWIKTFGVLFMAIALQFGVAGKAQAAFVLVTSSGSLGATDHFDWFDKGDVLTTISNPFDITSAGGVAAHVSETAIPGSDFRLEQQGPPGWAGNFEIGAHLLWTHGPNGPVTIDFDNATTITGAGAQIQTASLVDFTAIIEALDSSGNVLFSATRAGHAADTRDNTAIFIGIQATNGDSFDQIRFSISPANQQGVQDFAIGQLDFQVAAPLNAVPAPPGAVMFVLGFIGLAGSRLFRRKTATATA